MLLYLYNEKTNLIICNIVRFFDDPKAIRAPELLMNEPKGSNSKNNTKSLIAQIVINDF